MIISDEEAVDTVVHETNTSDQQGTASMMAVHVCPNTGTYSKIKLPTRMVWMVHWFIQKDERLTAAVRICKICVRLYVSNISEDDS